ncbi:MAG: 23S rRNA (uracil(1939)-C(5))-methyltransferase RlmD [Lachnospiraceae bacterium]|nr:23S rRNA (uracil(1939)-C(5))-methyltransferase RlmD [Lachnospiraceae bacterium]
MKKGQICEGTIEKLDFPNKGRIRIDGKTVTVKGGLPGQRVRFAVQKLRGGRAEGRILEVLEHAEAECEPSCPHYPACGGCIYQSLPYEEQLKLKAGQVKELLDEAVRDFDYKYYFEGIEESPRRLAYRNKMEFSFGDEVKDGPLSLGMHKRGSFYDVVTVDHCEIVDADFRRILRATLDYFTAKETPFYRKLRHEGYLRHLLVRKAVRTGEILVSLVTTTQREEDLGGWRDALLTLPLDGNLAGILHTKNDSLADVIQNDGTEILYGKDYFYEELLGLRFRISPFSFFQTNSLGAEILYETARSYIGDMKDQLAFDLYSGTGTIAQMLAPVARKVIGVEIVEEAVAAARENAQLNGLTNCEFIAGDVLKVLDTIAEKPDFIVLDPPRDGIHPKALKKIIDYGVERMLYISCKPTSLARDLTALQAAGYRMERARCVDMFPWTGNVETVCLLSKLHFKQHIEVEIRMDEMDLTAAEKKATYEEIKAYVLEHSGLNVSNLYIAQTKQKYGIIERENYNKPKSENARQPQCPPEKEKAITEALKYFGMISI